MGVIEGWGQAALRLLSITILVLCSQHAAGAQLRSADLVVFNAKVRTMTSRGAIAQALAVNGNRISAVGTNTQIRKLIGPETRVIDARGRLVIPGFNDAHVHFMGIGNAFSSIDLRDVKDVHGMTERISKYVRFLPKGRWILGGSWNSNWGPPDRTALDAMTPDNPVFIYQSDGKAAIANSVAFKSAGVASNGSGVDRDASGQPTGIVRGESLRRIAAVVPANHTRNWLEIAETATNYTASLGVTSVQDMHSDDIREIYRELERNGKLKTRVYDCIPLSDWKKLAGRRDDDEMVRGGCLKGFSDGDEEAAPKLLRDVTAADKAGPQIMIHAIGNSANRIVLDVFEQSAKANGLRDRRFRIEHAHNPSREDLSRFAPAKIIASMQPHLFENGNGEYYSTLLRQNVVLALGSDASITDLDPLLGIYAAVNAGPESISVYDAVRAYTVGSAYGEFQEKQKGTIEAGKLADFVILSEDIFTIERSRFGDAKVILTAIGGKVVYQEGGPIVDR